MMVKLSYIFILIIGCTSQLTAQNSLPKPVTSLPLDSLRKIQLRLVSADYYSSNLPFFCKKELQIQKIIKVPFKFRIGSVEEVDKLEGKHSGKP